MTKGEDFPPVLIRVLTHLGTTGFHGLEDELREMWKQTTQAAAVGGISPRPEECSGCIALQFKLKAAQDSIDGCAKKVAELAAAGRDGGVSPDPKK
jgi:hypothetical protein